jgi:hypothetical protein
MATMREGRPRRVPDGRVAWRQSPPALGTARRHSGRAGGEPGQVAFPGARHALEGRRTRQGTTQRSPMRFSAGPAGGLGGQRRRPRATAEAPPASAAAPRPPALSGRRPHPSSEARNRRSRLVCPCRRLVSTRRRWEARVGRVRFRGGVTSRAPASRAARRSMARDRFRVWERSSLAVTATTGPRRSTIRSRAHDGRLGEPAASKRTSLRVFDVLTCWPPGPPEVEKRQVSSCRGIRMPGATSTPGGGPGSGGDSVMATAGCYHGRVTGPGPPGHLSLASGRVRS